jgi:hypothetical protein
MSEHELLFEEAKNARFFEYDMAAVIQAGYERKLMHALKFGDWMDVEFWLEMRLDAYRRVRMVI